MSPEKVNSNRAIDQNPNSDMANLGARCAGVARCDALGARGIGGSDLKSSGIGNHLAMHPTGGLDYVGGERPTQNVTRASMTGSDRNPGRESTVVGYARFDSALLLCDASHELCERLGRSRSELIGCRFDTLFCEHILYDSCTIISDGTIAYVEAEVLMIDTWGRADVSEVRTVKVSTSAKNPMGCVNNQVEAEELRGVVDIDSRLGLLSNVQMRYKLGQAIDPGVNKAVTLMLINLDRFRDVNDSLGFENGNVLLLRVAERLRALLPCCTLLGRSRADEFVVLSEAIPLETPGIVSRILDSFNQAFVFGTEEIYVSASVGVSNFPLDGVSAEQLISAAESALYIVKKTGGRAAGYYDARLSSASKTRIDIDRYLRKALQRGEFELEYQPRLDLKTAEVAAVEALIRWNHPFLGRVSPLEFIPIAEEKGLIVDIGQWVLNKACETAVELSSSLNRPIRMSVNVSAHQLKYVDFYDQLVDALGRTQLSPHLLELELTESALIEDFEESARVLRRIKDLGIQLSIDDFGTGYSSLAYLQSFPFDTIKLDRGFVNHREVCANNGKFVKVLIDLAHGLELSVVAEGVECDEVAELLASAHCDEIQGYLLSKPLGKNALNAFLSSPLPMAIASANRVASVIELDAAPGASRGDRHGRRESSS